MSYQIILATKTGVRKTLPSQFVGECSFTADQSGNFTDATLTLHADADSLIAKGDRVDIFHQNVRRYRGYISEIRLSEGEPAELELTLYGRAIDLTTHVLQSAYTYPSKVDVSRVFAEIGQEFKARHPDVQISTEIIGVEIDSLDTLRKDCKSAIDSLVAYARSRCVWGFDVDSAGRDVLYLRRIAETAAHSIPLPASASGEREVVDSSADVVNSVIIEGGQPDFPQLLPNPSFEETWKSVATGAGNLLANGGFEKRVPSSNGLILDVWSVPNGSTSCETQDGIAAFVGSRQVKLDRIGDVLSQTRLHTAASPVIVRENRPFSIAFWMHPQPKISVDPPKVTVSLQWRKADGTAVGSPLSKQFQCQPSQEWRQFDFTVQSPADPLLGVAGYTLSFTDTSNGGFQQYREQGGILLDEAVFQDASTYYPAGWQAIGFGQGKVDALLCQSFSFPAKHGRNAVAIQYRAKDTDSDEVVFRYSPSVRLQNAPWDRDKPDYTFSVVGGQRIRFSAWFYLRSEDVPANFVFVFGWYKADGSKISIIRDGDIQDSTKRDQWQYKWQEETAPLQAAKCEVFLALRGDGTNSLNSQTVIIDAISARDAEDPDRAEFLDTGNLIVQVSAKDEITVAENAAANGSESVFGRREKVVSVSDITSIGSAKQWGREYLLVNAVAVPAPRISVYDYHKAINPGDRVRLVGADGTRYSDQPLPVARVQGEIGGDGILVYDLELVRPIPTEEELYAELLKKQMRSSVTASGSASGGSVPRGSSVSGSSTVEDASAVQKGISRLSVAPSNPVDPIAAGTNDPRMSDARVPLPHSHDVFAAGTTTGMVQLRGADGKLSADPELFWDGGGEKRLRFLTSIGQGFTIGQVTNEGIGLRYPDGTFLGTNAGGMRVGGGFKGFVATAHIFSEQDSISSRFYGSARITLGDAYDGSQGVAKIDTGTGEIVLPVVRSVFSTQVVHSIKARVNQTGDLSRWLGSDDAVLGSVNASGVARFAGYRSANGSQGQSTTTGGLSFLDGLYVGGNITGGSSGTVTSVGLSAPNGFIVTNSPVTGSGTLALALSGSLSGLVKVVSGGLQNAVAGTDFAAASHTHTLAQITDAGTAASRTVPLSGNATAAQVVLGNDIRLSDARTPTAHTHTLSDLTQSGAATGNVPTWDGSAWVPQTPASGNVAKIVVRDMFTPRSEPSTALAGQYTRVDSSSGASGVYLEYPTVAGNVTTTNEARANIVGTTIIVQKVDSSATPVSFSNFRASDPHPNAGTATGQNFAPLTARWQTAKFIFVQISAGVFAWERFI